MQSDLFSALKLSKILHICLSDRELKSHERLDNVSTT